MKPADNFYRFWCDFCDDGWHYRSACQSIVAKIVAGNADAIAANPTCVAAINKGRCKALDMSGEEIAKGATIYYVDRDDAGPGVTRREVARTPLEIAKHHALLSSLGLVANNSTTSLTRCVASVAKPPANKPSTSIQNAFDLAGMINAEIIQLKEAA